MDLEDRAKIKHMFRLGRTPEEVVLHMGYDLGAVKRVLKEHQREERGRLRRANKLAEDEPIGMDEYEARVWNASVSNEMFLNALAKAGHPVYA